MIVMATVEYPAGPAARHLGALAGVAGRWEDAERHFADALALEARFDSPFTLAHTLREYGRMLLRKGDWDRAAPILGRAAELCDRMQLPGLGAKVAALLKQ
jgi:hypothetical protein